jgi:hypothetical protein
VEDEIPPLSMALVLTTKTTTQEEWRVCIPRTEYSPRLGRLPTSRSEYGKGCQNGADEAKKRKTSTSAVASCVAGFYKYSSGHLDRLLASLIMLIMSLSGLPLATMVCPPTDPCFSFKIWLSLFIPSVPLDLPLPTSGSKAVLGTGERSQEFRRVHHESPPRSLARCRDPNAMGYGFSSFLEFINGVITRRTLPRDVLTQKGSFVSNPYRGQKEASRARYVDLSAQYFPV